MNPESLAERSFVVRPRDPHEDLSVLRNLRALLSDESPNTNRPEVSEAYQKWSEVLSRHDLVASLEGSGPLRVVHGSRTLTSLHQDVVGVASTPRKDSHDSGLLFLQLLSDNRTDDAIDLLLASSGRLRGYLFQHLASDLGGAEGVEVTILETVLHALTRYEDFDPTATGGLSWWLFCWGLVIAQERTEMRTQGQVAPAHACTLEDFWSAPEENPQTLEDLTAGIEVNQGLTDALIRAAQLGSGRAIDLALERWQPRILKMIRSSIGRELHAAYMDEYDLRQDVNLQVLKSLDTSKLSGRGSFPNFLYSIVRRRVLTAYRARRVPTVTGDQLSEVLDAYDDTNWMDGLEQGLQELARMNPKYESVLRMRLEAISHRRIAEALGCTESMSKVLTARAKAKLGSIVARLRNEGASED